MGYIISRSIAAVKKKSLLNMLAKISKADILTGNLVKTGGFLQATVRKLGEYADEDPFTE